MKKIKLQIKKRKIKDWLILALLICLIGLMIAFSFNTYKAEQLKKEVLLFSAEQNTYSERLQVVEEINNVYDKTSDGYQKIMNNHLIHTLIISDTPVNANNRYEIIPNWQTEFEEDLNQLNNQTNQYDNVLLRGSNILWAYMQVCTDLVNKDYDFVIIELNDNDLEQLSEEEFFLYYEALIRQLYSQFVDVEIFVTVNELTNLKFNAIQNNLNIVHDQYHINLLTTNQGESLSKIFIKSLFELLDGYNKSDVESINLIDLKDSENQPLFKIDKFTSSILPVNTKGFKFKKGLFYNTSSINYIEYEIEDPFVFMNYVTFVDGCEFDIFINDELYISLNSFSSVTGVGVIALPMSETKRIIRIVAKSEPESGKYLMMDNFLIGK